MDRRITRQTRLLYAEPLEGRLLMSANGGAALASPINTRRGEPDGAEMAVAAAELPRQVAQTIEANFPGARLVEAEIAIRRGMLVYDLGARLNRDKIDLAMTPAGEIVSSKSGPLSRSGVRVVDFDSTNEGLGNSQIDVSELPVKVVSAMGERFPGAKLLQAESTPLEEHHQFSISALVNGETLDATVTPHGRIVETGKTLTSSEIPQPVRDWIKQNFSDIGIDHAEVFTTRKETGYEVVIAPAGARAFEATLLVESPPAPRNSVESDRENAADHHHMNIASSAMLSQPVRDGGGSVPDHLSSGDTFDVPDSPPPKLQNVESASSVPGAEQTDATRVQAATQMAPRTVEAHDVGGPADAETAARVLEVVGFPRVYSTAWALPVAARAPVLLPKFASELCRVVPIDLTNVRKRLDDVLKGMDSLAARHAHPGGRLNDLRAVLRVAVILAAAACARIAYFRRARGRRGRAFGRSFGRDSSWNWVMGKLRT